MTKRVKIYEVGYKRPPIASQFKPGESGNRNGRPKGSRNFSTELDRELNKVVTITENGVGKKVRKKAVIAKQLVNKAASGDLKAAGILIAEGRMESVPGAATKSAPQPLLPEEEEVFAGVLARMRQIAQEPAQSSGEPGASPTPTPTPTRSRRVRVNLND